MWKCGNVENVKNRTKHTTGSSIPMTQPHSILRVSVMVKGMSAAFNKKSTRKKPPQQDVLKSNGMGDEDPKKKAKQLYDAERYLRCVNRIFILMKAS